MLLQSARLPSTHPPAPGRLQTLANVFQNVTQARNYTWSYTTEGLGRQVRDSRIHKYFTNWNRMLFCDCKQSPGKVSLQHSHEAEGENITVKPPTSAQLSTRRKAQGTTLHTEHNSCVEVAVHPRESLVGSSSRRFPTGRSADKLPVLKGLPKRSPSVNAPSEKATGYFKL